MLILIAGPYRSGTNDDPKLMQQNLSKLESVALPLFRLGHMPMIGEWVALPYFILRVQQGRGTKRMKKFYTRLPKDYL